jgi:hypothetical protein
LAGYFTLINAKASEKLALIEVGPLKKLGIAIRWWIYHRIFEYTSLTTFSVASAIVEGQFSYQSNGG